MANVVYNVGMEEKDIPLQPSRGVSSYITHATVLGTGQAMYEHGAQVFDPSKPFSSQMNRFDAVQKYEISQHWPEYNKFIGTMDSSMHQVGSALQDFHDTTMEIKNGLNQTATQLNQSYSAMGSAVYDTANSIQNVGNTLQSTYKNVNSSVAQATDPSTLNRDPFSNIAGAIGTVGAIYLGAKNFGSNVNSIANSANEVLGEVNEFGELIGAGEEVGAVTAEAAMAVPELAPLIALGALGYQATKGLVALGDSVSGGAVSSYAKSETDNYKKAGSDFVNWVEGWF